MAEALHYRFPHQSDNHVGGRCALLLEMMKTGKERNVDETKRRASELATFLCDFRTGYPLLRPTVLARRRVSGLLIWSRRQWLYPFGVETRTGVVLQRRRRHRDGRAVTMACCAACCQGAKRHKTDAD